MQIQNKVLDSTQAYREETIYVKNDIMGARFIDNLFAKTAKMNSSVPHKDWYISQKQSPFFLVITVFDFWVNFEVLLTWIEFCNLILNIFYVYINNMI